jgi:hypothetical protein
MALADDTISSSPQMSWDDFLPGMVLIIHHQFPGIELVSPLYYSDGICYLPPDQRIDAGSSMKAGFHIDIGDESICALMYTLQRKHTNQYNEDTISKEEARFIQLVVIWKANIFEVFYLFSHLIEYDKDCVWDEDKLTKLVRHHESSDIQYSPIEDTWLMHDDTVLMIRLDKVSKEGCCKIEMTISKTNIKDDTLRLQHIDMDK